MTVKKIGLLLMGVLVFASLATGDSATMESDGQTEYFMLLGADTSFDRERAPVPFNHDKHTGALNKDCSLCHYAKDKKYCILLTGIDSKSGDKDDYMNAYHDKCITCHEQYRTDKKKSGPVTCGACHPKDALEKVKPLKAVFEHPIHADILTSEESCTSCHIGINKKELKDVNQCASCHKDGKKSGILNKTKKHMLCQQCHFGIDEAEDIACNYCHKVKPEDVGKRVTRIMPTVPFDHDLHQETGECRDCHLLHERKGGHYEQAKQSCIECHEQLESTTYAGSQKLEPFELYHKKENTKGCVGCHTEMDAGPTYADCQSCHTGK